MSMDNTSMVEVEQVDRAFRLLFENGFRNVELPPLHSDDVADIAAALSDILSASTAPLRERVRVLEEALGKIASAYDTTLKNDPLWSKHIARTALENPHA